MSDNYRYNPNDVIRSWSSDDANQSPADTSNYSGKPLVLHPCRMFFIFELLIIGIVAFIIVQFGEEHISSFTVSASRVIAAALLLYMIILTLGLFGERGKLILTEDELTVYGFWGGKRIIPWIKISAVYPSITQIHDPSPFLRWTNVLFPGRILYNDVDKLPFINRTLTVYSYKGYSQREVCDVLDAWRKGYFIVRPNVPISGLFAPISLNKFFKRNR